VLCSNVLSAIPSAKIRAKSLRAIYAALSTHGELLVVNQYKNSYFTEVSKKRSTIKYLDGWIAKSRSGSHYYGALDKDKVIGILHRRGFRVAEAWTQGQSSYVVATRRE
jgi:hypothetical protein